MKQNKPAMRIGEFMRLVVLVLSITGCNVAAAEDNTSKESIDIELATELARLGLYAYQQLTDFVENRTFTLPDPYILQEQFYTSQRFTGDLSNINQTIPIAYAATLDEKIFLVFRGTKTISEWDFNAKFKQVDFTLIANGGMTHKGFTEIYQSVHEPILATVNNLLMAGNYSKLYVTGHSLGGALAIMATTVLSEQTTLVPIMYNLAAPRVGDPTFASRYGVLVNTSWRIVNENDLVPRLPPPMVVSFENNESTKWSYEHVVSKYALNFGKFVINPLNTSEITANHSLCNYYSALCDMSTDAATCKALAEDVDNCKP